MENSYALEKHNDTKHGSPAIRLQASDPGGGKTRCRASTSIEAENREGKLQETYLAWVKGHKDIKDNEAADKLRN